jgi:hypothetical protein
MVSMTGPPELDPALVRAAQRGDRIAVADLMDALAPYVGRVCGPIALQDGPDAAQEALIAIFKNLGGRGAAQRARRDRALAAVQGQAQLQEGVVVVTQDWPVASSTRFAGCGSSPPQLPAWPMRKLSSPRRLTPCGHWPATWNTDSRTWSPTFGHSRSPAPGASG